MRTEKSCGAVVVHREENGYSVLVEQMRQGHFSIPKGHVEGSETESETAAREILEETGLTVVPDTAFRREVAYSPAPGVMKTVIFFVARAESTETVCQECEVREIRFMTPEEAEATLTFASDRAVVRDALAYLAAKNS